MFAGACAQVLNPDLVKGPWRKEEDDKVRELVALHGAKKLSFISSHLPGRIGKQCRERCAHLAAGCSAAPSLLKARWPRRWHNHLNPDIRKEPWTDDEEEQLLRAHAYAPLTHELSHAGADLSHSHTPTAPFSQEDGEQVGRDRQVPAWPH